MLTNDNFVETSYGLHIKNMVCHRCIKVVKEILSTSGIQFDEIRLGEVILSKPLDKDQLPALKASLEAEGFELIDDKRSRLVSQIKSLLVELIHYGDLESLHLNISDYLSQNLYKDYHYLSNLFSESENLTIEQFVIYQKIEKVKELLVYDELSLSEISFRMGYSSVAHLSAQFKKITGFTPTQFKKLKEHNRRPLDKI
jgi:AraC-like DNA-binding protein